MRPIASGLWIALWVAACAGLTPGTSPSVDATGILLVQVGETVQAKPPSEAVAIALSVAMELADANGNDLGYPWIDPSSAELVLSAATQRGHELLLSAGIAVPHRIREVAHGVAELRRIQDEATFLSAQGVPDAKLLFQTIPDQRDNRALLVIQAMSRPLLDYLARHYPVDAIAVEVNPAGPNGGT